MGTVPHSFMMTVEAQTTVTSVIYVSNSVYRVHMCKLIAKYESDLWYMYTSHGLNKNE